MDSIKPSARKLPIKRKTPDSNTILIDPIPNPPPPAYKFHRIWTEPDELRFLQGLLDSATQSLSFPRDLDNFSNTTSQPYTKSQLSEKLRRLRKKFRVISSRLARGFHSSMLSPHDQALYDLSKKLWSPDYSSTSPFGYVSDDDVDDGDDGFGGGIKGVAARAVMNVFDQCLKEVRMVYVHQGLLFQIIIVSII